MCWCIIHIQTYKMCRLLHFLRLLYLQELLILCHLTKEGCYNVFDNVLGIFTVNLRKRYKVISATIDLNAINQINEISYF